MEKRLRTERIELRVTKAEKEMILHRMKLCDEKNMTRYIRRMAIDGCIFHVDSSSIDTLNYELNKIGTNINQIAHKINGTGSIYESDMKNISEAMRTIWQLLKSTLLDEH